MAPPVEGATVEDGVDKLVRAAAAVVLVANVRLLAVVAPRVEVDDSVMVPEGEDEADEEADEDKVAGDVCCRR